MHIPRLLIVLALLLPAVGLAPLVRSQAVPSFLDTFDGNPTSPEPFASPRWSILHFLRDIPTGAATVPMEAQHGPGCEPPTQHHHIDQRRDGTFLCNGHVMTALNDPAYGMLTMTPDVLADWSAGEAVVRWDVSTLKTSERDWWEVWIMPPGEALPMPINPAFPAGYGIPNNAIMIVLEGDTLRTFIFRDGIGSEPAQASWAGYEDWLTPDAARRDTFELRISDTHLKLWMPGYNRAWMDTDIPALGWQTGVVQWQHHSYTPNKDCPVTPTLTVCAPNTWHWDNMGISPARQRTLVKPSAASGGDYAVVADDREVTLAAPAPVNATLQFHSVYPWITPFDWAGQTPPQAVSFDGGPWVEVAPMLSTHEKWPPLHAFAVPVPAGTTRLRFRPISQNVAGPWHVAAIAVWADAAPVPTPTATPVPPTQTPTPTATATSTPVPPSATSTATPTPTSLPAGTPTRTPTVTRTPTSTTGIAECHVNIRRKMSNGQVWQGWVRRPADFCTDQP